MKHHDERVRDTLGQLHDLFGFVHDKHMYDLLMRMTDLFENESAYDAACACSCMQAFLLVTAYNDIDKRRAALDGLHATMLQITLNEDLKND